MKGDFSRNTYRPEKHYTQVRMQQGRVQLDSDWNEQVDIQEGLARETRRHLIGPHGGPKDEAGFNILWTNAEIKIGHGKYYVNGILVENAEVQAGNSNNNDSISFKDQPVSQEELSPTRPGQYVVYLDVWERDVASQEDPNLREVALRGPDTTTRVQTVWQVKCEGVNSKSGKSLPTADWKPGIDLQGRLKVRLNPDYEGLVNLSNQLYRVEIHDGQDSGNGQDAVKFKWSRDNGSVVYPIEEPLGGEASNDPLEGPLEGEASNDPQISPTKFRLKHTGLDERTKLRAGDWLEFVNDNVTLGHQIRPLMKVKSVGDHHVGFEQKMPGEPIKYDKYPFFRRWDVNKESLWEGEASSEVAEGAWFISVGSSDSDGWINIEEGIQVKFDLGTAETNTEKIYKTGDYWTFGTREVLKGIVGSNSDFHEPEGIKHHYAPLALLEFTADPSTEPKVQDLRKPFIHATDLASFDKIGGDDQEGRPGKWLREPLRVSVASVQGPIEGVKVEFKIVQGEGFVTGKSKFTERDPDFAPVNSYLRQDSVTTDSEGVAQCFWALDPTSPLQEVEAVLIGEKGRTIHRTLRFAARLEMAMHYVSGDGQEGGPFEVLPGSLEVRVSNRQGPVSGVKVKFKSVTGNGMPLLDADMEVVASQSDPNAKEQFLTVKTNDKGLASCQWKLDDIGRTQRMEAQLVGFDKEPTGDVLRFNARVVAVLRYLEGDNQVGTPGQDLDKPFRVIVQGPRGRVAGARVHVKLDAWNWDGEPLVPTLPSGFDKNKPLTTDGAGTAQLQWPMSQKIARLEVEMFLLDWEDKPTGTPVRFTARSDIRLSYVGGDGQEAMPGDWLPHPLEVQVISRNQPFEGARVKFVLKDGDKDAKDPDIGLLETDQGYGLAVETISGSEGVAKCRVQLKSRDEVLKIRAELDDFHGTEMIHFNTNPSTSSQLAYTPGEDHPLPDVTVVKEALDGLRSNVTLQYVGGDGQQAMRGEPLSKTLQVRVANGQWPVGGASVKFRIMTEEAETLGNVGILVDPNADNQGEEPNTNSIEITPETDADGLARCSWILGSEEKALRVQATLEDASGTAEIIFSAEFSTTSSIAYEGEDRPGMPSVRTAEEALEQLRNNTFHHYVGGDGQEGRPGEWLREPLRVAVSGTYGPVAGVKVIFRVLGDQVQDQSSEGEVLGETPSISVSGTQESESQEASTTYGLADPEPETIPDSKTSATREVVRRTDTNGIAQCFWKLSPTAAIQKVEAVLADDTEGILHRPLEFQARLEMFLHYISGDGQEAGRGEKLLHPLVVKVRNRQGPIRDAEVRFGLSGFVGYWDRKKHGYLSSQNESYGKLILKTDSRGIVTCDWTLGLTSPCLEVTASLFSSESEDDGIRFCASLRPPASLSTEVNQPDHGFSVGKVVYLDLAEGIYKLANAGITEAMFMVSQILDKDNFVGTQAGRIQGLADLQTEDLQGLQKGQYYYVSSPQGTPGEISTSLETGQNPILLADSESSGFVLPFLQKFHAVAAGAVQGVKGNVAPGQALTLKHDFDGGNIGYLGQFRKDKHVYSHDAYGTKFAKPPVRVIEERIFEGPKSSNSYQSFSVSRLPDDRFLFLYGGYYQILDSESNQIITTQNYGSGQINRARAIALENGRVAIAYVSRNNNVNNAHLTVVDPIASGPNSPILRQHDLGPMKNYQIVLSEISGYGIVTAIQIASTDGVWSLRFFPSDDLGNYKELKGFAGAVIKDIWKTGSNSVAVVSYHHGTEQKGKVTKVQFDSEPTIKKEIILAGSRIGALSSEMIGAKSIVLAYHDGDVSNNGRLAMYDFSTDNEELKNLGFFYEEPTSRNQLVRLSKDRFGLFFTAGRETKWVMYDSDGKRLIEPRHFRAGYMEFEQDIVIPSDTEKMLICRLAYDGGGGGGGPYRGDPVLVVSEHDFEGNIIIPETTVLWNHRYQFDLFSDAEGRARIFSCGYSKLVENEYVGWIRMNQLSLGKEEVLLEEISQNEAKLWNHTQGSLQLSLGAMELVRRLSQVSEQE